MLVKSVRFTGAAGLASEAELQAVVADAIGKERDFAGLEALVRRVTGYLRGRGGFLAEAYLPRQDITDGHIEIVVRAGRCPRGGAGQRLDQTPAQHLSPLSRRQQTDNKPTFCRTTIDQSGSSSPASGGTSGLAASQASKPAGLPRACRSRK